jgi:hypothetical protein
VLSNHSSIGPQKRRVMLWCMCSGRFPRTRCRAAVSTVLPAAS